MSREGLYINCYERVFKEHSFAFFSILIGGRGTGKSFSTLRDCVKNKKVFMYLRRTQTELDNCCSASSNPFKKINSMYNWDIQLQANKDNVIILDKKNEKLVGYAAALSTFGKFRGADFSDVEVIIFDEFINTTPFNNIKNEANMLFNLIETVNRNRELDGEEPVKVILLSNANTIDSDIIRALKLGEVIKNMKEQGIEDYEDHERGLYLSLLSDTGIRELKSQTSLYKLTRGTSFYDMSINNEFTVDYFGDTRKLNYQEFTPLCGFKGIYFYKHKSKQLIYVTKRKANCQIYEEHQKDKFLRDYGFMIKNYIVANLIIYSDYDLKLDVLNMV